MASPLVEKLILQMLGGNQQPMLSPLAPIGKIALAAALKNAEKKREAKEAAQIPGIVDAIAGKALDPQAFSKLPEGTQEAPRYWGQTVPAFEEQQAAPVRNQQRTLVESLMGGDPEVGRQMALKQWEASLQGADKPEFDFTTIPDEDGNQVRVRTNKATGESMVVYKGGKKPPGVSVQTDVNVGGNKFEEGAGSAAAKAFDQEYTDALSASQSLPNYSRAMQLLDKNGVIAGTGADARLALGRLATTLGFTGGENVQGTEEYLGLTGKFVAEQIKSFGAGTGLSDADREFARQIAGGAIDVTPGGLKRLIKMGQTATKNKVKYYNQRWDELSPESETVRRYYKKFPIDEAAPTQAPDSDLSELSDEELLKRALKK